MKNVLWGVLVLCSTACAAAVDTDGSELEVSGQEEALSSVVDLLEGCANFDEDAWRVCYYSTRNVRVNGPTTVVAGIKYYATSEHWFNGEARVKGYVRCYNSDSGDWYDESFDQRHYPLPVSADGSISHQVLTCREGYRPESMPTEFWFTTTIVES